MPVCVGETIPMTEEGWKQAVDELVNSAAFILKLVVMFGATELSGNMLNAVNALTCMVTNLGGNTWNIFGVVWYSALEFGYEKEVKKYIDEYYPYICTCREETAELQEKANFGMNMMIRMGSCSEKLQMKAA